MEERSRRNGKDGKEEGVETRERRPGVDGGKKKKTEAKNGKKDDASRGGGVLPDSEANRRERMAWHRGKRKVSWRETWPRVRS